MGDRSKIEWTDATWNVVRGCTPISPGCKNCYASRQARRMDRPGGAYEGLTKAPGKWTGEVRIVPELLEQPLKWRKPRRIFVCSMSDLFHEDVPASFLADVFDVMRAAKHHTFQVLTKRAFRMARQWVHWPANVWAGVTVENQRVADERIPLLLETRAMYRFLSIEPLLGPVDLTPPARRDTNVNQDDWLHRISWIIVGGETGPGARPMHPDWVRSVRDRCENRKNMGRPWPLAFHFKQWGDWQPCAPDDWHAQLTESAGTQRRVGKKAAGRELDGRIHDEMPGMEG